MATFAEYNSTSGVEKISTIVKSKKKAEFYQHFERYVNQYSRIVFFTAENIPTASLQQLRVQLRTQCDNAVLLMGKNTLVRRILRNLPDLSAKLQFLPYIRGHMGYVFTNTEIEEVTQLLSSVSIRVGARVGNISPCNVVISKGPTDKNPSTTAFFRAVGIESKIVKNQIEVVKDVELLKTGDRVTASHVALMDLLAIKPFEHRLKIRAWYDSSLNGGTVIEYKDNGEVKDWLSLGVQRISALLLGLNLELPKILALPSTDVSVAPPTVDDDQSESSSDNEPLFDIFGSEEGEAESFLF